MHALECATGCTSCICNNWTSGLTAEWRGVLFYLCSTGWQQLDIILFVAWDTAGEKYGIPLSLVGDKSNKILNFIQLERMFWEAPSVTMLPCGQS